MSESHPRAANLLGALALAVTDRLRDDDGPGPDGLDISQAAALVTLLHYPGQSVAALGATLGLTHSGAVRLADRLGAAGLATRSPAGRGRTLALILTRSGEQAAAQVLARRQASAEQLVGQLSQAEARALEQLAGRMLAGLTTDRASALRLCRLCDEPLCGRAPGCPVDGAVAG
jgi:DNA-binding MarR family transcriptional regulator